MNKSYHSRPRQSSGAFVPEKKSGTCTIAARSRLRFRKKGVNIVGRQAVLDGDHYRSSLLNMAKR
jgi:hypothetical protein